ncbi:MAG: hypothetical protein AABW92_01450, partial [Nanoarchaeota archaeon]
MADGSPMNDILEMKQRGISNNEIIQNLQRQGYSNTQIFDAMSQADTKMAVEGTLQPLPKPPQHFEQENEDIFTQPPIEQPALKEQRSFSSESMSMPQDSTLFFQFTILFTSFTSS